MAVEFVTVRNPANDSIGRMSKRTFENNFADKGFELVEDEEVETTEAEEMNTSRRSAAQGQSEESEQGSSSDEG